MDGLAPADARFLVRTAVLDEVTVRGAEALGEVDAGERLTALRAAHLPVSWPADGTALRCHARFREYLLARVERLPSHEVARLRLGHGRLLAADGLHEEATDELLRAGARDEALDSAEHAIVGVIDRLDLAVAERWVSELGSAHRADMLPMLTAELMLAVAREDYKHGRRLADRVEAEGRRNAMAAASPRCAALMAWCYLHAGRIDDVRALLDVAPDDPTVDAVRWALRPLRDGPAEMLVPAATGGAVDALLLRACYHLGRLTELTDVPHSRWAEAVTEPWRIGALRATGRTQLALELYEAARADGVGAVGLHAQVGPELLIDTGHEQEARAALVEGRDVARRSGSLIFELFNGVVAAKLELRLARDPWAAQGVLHRLERELGARRFPHVREMVDTWFGMALLLQNDNAEALRRLRRAVAGMLAGDRLLELPTAAVFLAEAEWRAGEEERADRAADLAVDAAGRQGSNHMLIQALTDFPATVSRRIDAEPGVDSVWHDLGRTLAARDVPIEGALGDPVVLEEFGPPAIVVAGEPTRPRIVKSYELLAYLALRHPMPVTREELLDALFEGRADESARAYLRQAAHQLRQVLPGDDAVVTEGARMRLADGLRLTAESHRLERDLAEANRLRGEERLTATLNALRAADRGAVPGGRRVRLGRRAPPPAAGPRDHRPLRGGRARLHRRPARRRTARWRARCWAPSRSASPRGG